MKTTFDNICVPEYDYYDNDFNIIQKYDYEHLSDEEVLQDLFVTCQ